MKSFLSYTQNPEPKTLREAKLKAEDYEAAIVLGFLDNNQRPVTDPEQHGIPPKIYDAIQQTPEAIDIGRTIASHVQTHFGLSGTEKAEVYGRAQAGLTKFWSSFDATNTTPKTDILIADKRISLKMGVAQLMSGGKAESTATFHAALRKTPELTNSSQVNKVKAILNSFVESSIAPGQLRGIIKSGENEVVNAAESAHKQCMQELGALFDQSDAFKVEFAREAMSGFSKFGENSNAAAEFMLVADTNGAASIHSVYDDNYCMKIAERMKLASRFKTSSRKIKGKKTGEYKFWSVVSLIVNAMEESTEEIDQDILTEGLLQNISDRLKKFLSKTWRRILLFVSRKVKNLMSFLGVEDVTVEVNNEVNFRA